MTNGPEIKAIEATNIQTPRKNKKCLQEVLPSTPKYLQEVLPERARSDILGNKFIRVIGLG